MKMTTVGGPWPGHEVEITDGIHTVDVPFTGENGVYVVHYDVRQGALLFRDWKWAKRRHRAQNAYDRHRDGPGIGPV